MQSTALVLSSVSVSGTNSTVGVGFRLGDHAHFQVLLELGPQVTTQTPSPATDNKTQSPSAATDNKIRRQVQPPALAVMPATKSEVLSQISRGKWLSSWRSALVNTQDAVRIHDTSKSLGNYMINTVLWEVVHM